MDINKNASKDSSASIVLDEKFDFSSVNDFRKAYEGITKSHQNTVVVDFKHTRFIDSSALGMLMNARGHFENHGLKVKIVNANEKIQKIFSISGFHKKFEIV